MKLNHVLLAAGTLCATGITSVEATAQVTNPAWAKYISSSDANLAVTVSGLVPCRVPAPGGSYYAGAVVNNKCRYSDGQGVKEAGLQQFEYMVRPNAAFVIRMVERASGRVPTSTLAAFRGSGAPTRFMCQFSTYSTANSTLTRVDHLGWWGPDGCRSHTGTLFPKAGLPGGTILKFPVIHPGPSGAGVASFSTYWRDITAGGMAGLNPANLCRVKLNSASTAHGGILVPASTVAASVCKVLKLDSANNYSFVDHSPSATTKVEALLAFDSSQSQIVDWIQMPPAGYFPNAALELGQVLGATTNKMLLACQYFSAPTGHKSGLWVDGACRSPTGSTPIPEKMLVLWSTPSF
jgi:hypothetical protein